ncbi:MAG: CpsB/CapC family capsule biosynthesis tyrosine phosphatase [Methanomassiliicoccus sp.]|nr:CpsB/CapC family capsule biosynthesis tyrosine phosphatase [Methanomassiliicoccus sp.]
MGANSLINLHTHTKFSDGDFTPEQIILTAEANHLTHIGISDHLMTKKCNSLYANQLENYIEVIRELQSDYPKVAVLVGVEIDTAPQRCDLESLPIDLLNQLDYVLFEYVEMEEGTELDDLEPLLSQINVPCGLAHNDIERNFGPWPPDSVAEHIASHGVFVEINTAWPYKRDGMMYWERAERYYREFHDKVLVSVGTDVHHSLAEVYNLDKAYQFLRRTNLLGDLVV